MSVINCLYLDAYGQQPTSLDVCGFRSHTVFKKLEAYTISKRSIRNLFFMYVINHLYLDGYGQLPNHLDVCGFRSHTGFKGFKVGCVCVCVCEVFKTLSISF
jgi:hypothetical protein